MTIYVFSPVTAAVPAPPAETKRGLTVKRKYLWFLTPLLLLGFVAGEAALSWPRPEGAALVAAPQARQPAPVQPPTIKLPAEINGNPGEFIRVAAETNGSEVRWLNLDSGLNIFPVELLRDTKTAVVTARIAGRYRLAAWTAKGDVPSEAAVCVVVIGSPGPTPPGPDPTPPEPTPPPDDQLTRTLRAAYQSDLAAGKAKAEWVKLVAEVFRAAPDILSNKKNTGEVEQHLIAAIGQRVLMPPGSMPAMKKALADHLAASLPKDGFTPLTPELRDLCRQLLLSTAEALGRVVS